MTPRYLRVIGFFWLWHWHETIWELVQSFFCKTLAWNCLRRICFFVRDSGMKLLDLSEGFLLERVWHETMWELVQRVSLRDSGVTICEMFVECFVLRLLYEDSWRVDEGLEAFATKIKTGKQMWIWEK